MAATPTFADLEAAAERGDDREVVRLGSAAVAARPGDDAAHELLARAYLSLGELERAEQHASDAVRLDPEEIRYRELLADVLAAQGAHRDAADEFARLARQDPSQSAWEVAEARQRLGAAQPELGVEAARRAVRLDPANADAQLALARGLIRLRDPRAALQAATAAADLLPGNLAARETLADARWLSGEGAAAFSEFRTLAHELTSDGERQRVTAKARALYRQHAGWFGRLVAGVPAVFGLAFRNGWLHV
ncbi:MAG TPA: tetratricopeptide repeat protein [Candidatus Limnocylindria bacterium]|nr:tetratricopeptide repeat protein [Candidatus Limnocylindria bacterium]